MKQDPEASGSGSSQPARSRSSRVHFLLLPRRSSLHPHIRLVIAAAANVFLAVWVLPQFGHIQDPAYSPINAIQISVQVIIPCATLLILAPVFLLARDIPRLLAIGLSFFPAYVAVVGFGAVIDLWAGGR
jgi:hypothetical protein